MTDKTANPRSSRPRAFFSREEQALIAAAIHDAEMKSSGEIRCHLEHKVPRNRPFNGDPYLRARGLFARIGMHETLERNGVLFYLATGSRRFAVLGDEELHKKVGEEFWRQAADLMNGEFKAGRFVEGLTAAIALVGAQLAEHFPRKSDDVNELPDTISFQE